MVADPRGWRSRFRAGSKFERVVSERRLGRRGRKQCPRGQTAELERRNCSGIQRIRENKRDKLVPTPRE